MRIWIPLTLLALAGCGSHNSTFPTAPAPAPSPGTTLAPVAATLGGPWNHPAGTTAAIGLWDLTLDPVNLTATSTLQEQRVGQQDDDLFLAPLSNFLRSDSFRVTGVSGTATTVSVHYEFAHPFPAPEDPAGTPNGFSNRADLGFAGIIAGLFDLSNANGHTFFTDTVANTALLSNADGYLRPHSMIVTDGIANTFPYKLIVDERGSTGNRIGISNGGDPTGNYGADSWTRAEMGASRPFNQWTGYGVLQQGQRSANTFDLDRATLAGDTVTLTIAVVAHYIDPRAGATQPQRYANRLPAVTPDALTTQCYRMPHGAWDNQRVQYDGESGGFRAGSTTFSTLRFHVEDWDARATESASTDLALDPDPSHVAIGEAGLPTLSICIPGVLGDATVHDDWDTAATITDDDTAFGGDATVDSGHPNDGLFFTKSVSRQSQASDFSGVHTGLIRVTDPEILLPVNFVLPLDATLRPLTGDLPEAVTYQAFQVTMGGFAPSATVDPPAEDVPSGDGVLTLTVAAYDDADGDALQIQFDWNGDNDFDDLGEAYQPLTGTPPVTFDSPLFYSNATLVNANQSLRVQITDGDQVIIAVPFWTLGPNQAPKALAGSVGLQNASGTSPFTFELSAPLLAVADPEGDAITYTVSANGINITSDLTSVDGFNASPVMGPYSYSSTGLQFNVYANDLLHLTTNGRVLPDSPLAGTVERSPGGAWAYVSSTVSNSVVAAESLGRDSNGDILVGGLIQAGGDLGGGPAPATSLFVARLSTAGAFEMERLIPVGNATDFSALGIDGGPGGSIIVSGVWRGGSVDFGGGSRQIHGGVDTYVVKYDHDGNYVWDFVTTGSGSEDIGFERSAQPMAVDPNTGDIYLTGGAGSNCQFGLIQFDVPSSEDPFVARLDNNGVPVYATSFTSTIVDEDENDAACGILLGATGTLYLTGAMAAGIDLGGGTHGTAGDWFLFLTARNASDGSWIWDRAVQTSVTRPGFGAGLSTDGTSIYCSGLYSNGMDFGGGARASTGTRGIFVAAFDAADGSWVWDRTFGDTGQNDDFGRCVWVDGTQLYAAGTFKGSLDFGTGPVSSGTTTNAFYQVRLDPLTGVTQWASASQGPDFETGFALRALDGTGPIVAGGIRGVVDVDPGPAQGLIGQASRYNAYVLHLNADGTF